MELPVCWLFFDAVLLPGDPAVFAGHTHNPDYIGDYPVDGYLVGCNVCLVNAGVVVLTYDTAVLPPDQSGVIITPTDPLRAQFREVALVEASVSAQRPAAHKKKKTPEERKRTDSDIEDAADMVFVPSV